MTMTNLYTANDAVVLEDVNHSVVLDYIRGDALELSITDVESIHEWTGEWLKKRETERKARG